MYLLINFSYNCEKDFVLRKNLENRNKNPTQTNLTNQTENNNILFIHIHKFQHNCKTTWANISISVNTEGRKNNFCWVWGFNDLTSQILVLDNSFWGALPLIEWLIRFISPSWAKWSSHSQSMRNRAMKVNNIRRRELGRSEGERSSCDSQTLPGILCNVEEVQEKKSTPEGIDRQDGERCKTKPSFGVMKWQMQITWYNDLPFKRFSESGILFSYILAVKNKKSNHYLKNSLTFVFDPITIL